MPTEAERRNLSRLMYLALVDVRALLSDGQSRQAKDLTEAFHNIPLLMYSDDFSFEVFRDFLESYLKKYVNGARFDYLQEWQKLSAATT